MQRNKKQISIENYYVMGKGMQVEINETISGDKWYPIVRNHHNTLPRPQNIKKPLSMLCDHERSVMRKKVIKTKIIINLTKVIKQNREILPAILLTIVNHNHGVIN